MNYPPSGKAFFATQSGIHRLTRWLVAVLLIYFSIESLHGLDRMFSDQALSGEVSAAGLLWLKVIGLPQVRGILLGLAAVLLAFVTGGLWPGASSSWLRWWMGVPFVLMTGASWTIWVTSKSHWLPVLSIVLSLLLFLIAVGLATCTAESGRCFGVVKEDFQRPGIFAMGVLATLVLVVHVVFGIGGEGSPFGGIPHLVCMVASASMVVSLVAMVLRRHPEIRALTRPAIALVYLLPAEMLLGNWCYLLGVRQSGEAWLPLHQNAVVFAGELHLLGGGVLGALSLLVTLRARTQLTARVIASPLKRGAVEA